MAQEPNAVEQAVSRALRENLERIQRNADELHQAVGDIVAACASTKPTNALPSMLRAQTSAASLSAALEVLSRFVAMAVQPGQQRSPLEAQIAHLNQYRGPRAGRGAGASATGGAYADGTSACAGDSARSGTSAAARGASGCATRCAAAIEPEPLIELEAEGDAIELIEPQAPAISPEAEFEGDFDVNHLTPEEQELHRRANRVAKVSMQDIKMLRPEQVRLGREKKDLCIRLKDDIEKAHREYDRRFKPIMDHPVDYFYRWMVEILAEGDAHALGEYPYATPARHR